MEKDNPSQNNIINIFFFLNWGLFAGFLRGSWLSADHIIWFHAVRSFAPVGFTEDILF